MLSQQRVLHTGSALVDSRFRTKSDLILFVAVHLPVSTELDLHERAFLVVGAPLNTSLARREDARFNVVSTTLRVVWSTTWKVTS